MLINSAEGQEVRIAIVDGGVLEELYVERASSASRVGNVYKGRITNVEASIQAAFVDFGLAKNGFLHIADIRPEYFPGKQKGSEAVGRKRSHRERPPIQDCLKRGQEVLVQLTKEGIGTKGPTLTTYLSIPGRLLVMMPGMSRLGVSRKIEDQRARSEAKALLANMKLPPDMGFILRTAGFDRSKREFQRDLTYLTRLWNVISQQVKKAKAPAAIYQESDLITRTLRDTYSTQIDRIICDSEPVAHKVEEFLELVMPRTKHRVEMYTGANGLFHDSGLEEEIEKIYARRVELPLGGSLIIDQTEALVAIDVNSGRFRKHADAETTALKINIDAAKEIARQLRLRDLGGVIVMDFIDMRPEKNRRAVEKALRDAMKPDRAKTKMDRISSFGIIEMTRQRMGPSLAHGVYTSCPHCGGEGMIKSRESLSLEVMRRLRRACAAAEVAQIEVAVEPGLAQYLSNKHRKELSRLEAQSAKVITITADAQLAGDEVNITATNARGSKVACDKTPGAKGKRTIKSTPLDKRPPSSGTGDSAGKDEDSGKREAKAKKRRRRPRGKKKPQSPDKADDEQARRDKRTVAKALFSDTAPAAPGDAGQATEAEAAKGDASEFSPADILAGEHRRGKSGDKSKPGTEDPRD
ncbi:MAG: Rne/Rng family ribonuclease [Phycisphaerae bacterium]|nr:Rne/Rng family ribonuclease [Phycisphaerae bacterium]